MMNTLDIWLLAVALAMDCFTVSIMSGVILRKRMAGLILRMAAIFGLFQMLMPFVGWLATNHFSEQLKTIDHWIAFGLLVFIGGKMAKESFEKEEEEHFNPLGLKTQIVLAIATSIDALAVGISFACTGCNQAKQLTVPLIIIGFVSFALSITGYLLGVKFGKGISRKIKPELLGGIILILIGVKILVEHLFLIS